MIDSPSNSRRSVLLIGATSQIGRYLLPALVQAEISVRALSRQPRPSWCPPEAEWITMDVMPHGALRTVEGRAGTAIHLAPLSFLPPLVEDLARLSVTRIIAFGSTSRFTKADSPNPTEVALAGELVAAEVALAMRCAAQGIAWTVFRPTVIYGERGRDAVQFIARHIGWAGFFPIADQATGLRQPVHAEDLAWACLAALDAPSTFNRGYNLSGGERLTYRNMVERIFQRAGRPARIVRVPLTWYRLAFWLLRRVPGYGHLTGEMAARMNQDLSFDSQDAHRDFGYAPRTFLAQARPPLPHWEPAHPPIVPLAPPAGAGAGLAMTRTDLTDKRV